MTKIDQLWDLIETSSFLADIKENVDDYNDKEDNNKNDTYNKDNKVDNKDYKYDKDEDKDVEAEGDKDVVLIVIIVLDVLNVLGKTRGLYQVPELIYICHICRPYCCPYCPCCYNYHHCP